MMRAGAWLLVPAVLVAALVGGALSTTAWLYQTRDVPEEPPIELVGSPVPPVLPAAIATKESAERAKSHTPDVNEGQQVYQQFCNSCHPGGEKGVGPAVRGAAFRAKYQDDASLRKVIVEGTGPMPGFRQLTGDQVDSLVAYIHSLK